MEVTRHVYQSSTGGSIYTPLEKNSNLIKGATPKLAKTLGSKYARISGSSVRSDLLENHGRQLSEDYILKVAQEVGKEVGLGQDRWTYDLPDAVLEKTQTVSIGRDGTTMYLRTEGYREAMSGTISFYDEGGVRLHTIYRAQAPEYGKQTFNENFGKLIDQSKHSLKQAKLGVNYIGLADGAVDNWTFLEPYTDENILDYWHGSEYLTLASHSASYAQSEQKQWLETARSDLKNGTGAAQDLLDQMLVFSNKRKLNTSARQGLKKATTYFENHKHQMDYAKYQELGYPIGSGVTEAACKVVVKQRMCCSGMKWNNQTAQNVLYLRTLICSDGQWMQFWNNIDHFGFADN